ncbi:MAG: TlpA disulfide reductase family protein [Gallionellaceae bacterium]
MPVAIAATGGHGPAVGKPAPALFGKTLDGGSYILKRDTGSPKVINFFSMSCVPCRKEMPELAQYEKKYAGIKFISVHTEEAEPEKIAGYLKKLIGHPSNIVLTSGGLQTDFNYMGLPHTIVLDENNNVLMNLEGYNSGNMRRLKKQLDQMSR